jgi:hypothetical protein
MTFREAQWSLQVLAEERIGAAQRAAMIASVAEERRAAEAQAALRDGG